MRRLLYDLRGLDLLFEFGRSTTDYFFENHLKLALRRKGKLICNCYERLIRSQKQAFGFVDFQHMNVIDKVGSRFLFEGAA